MKDQKRCPKCSSADVAEIPGGRPGYNWLPVGWGTVPVDRWVCCACGYSEEWIAPEHLAKVREYWGAAGQSKPN